MDETPRRKVALITGASSGIGEATARRFLEAGYVVHGAARRLGAMADIAKAGARVHHLDLLDGSSIEACVASVVAEGNGIDVLVNNAGYGAYGSVEEMSLRAGRDQMEVNFFGLVHLIKAALPAMRARRRGRIVNVTSIGGKVSSPLGAWYHASKFAVEGFSDSLRNELRPFGIDVVVVAPGGTDTAWNDVALKAMREVSGAGPYRALVEAWERVIANEKGVARPREIAEVILRAAEARHPRARYAAPFSARLLLWFRWLLDDRAFDWLMYRKIFGLSATSERQVRPDR